MKFYDNIFINKSPEFLKYISKKQWRGNTRIPTRNRLQHGQRLQNKLQRIWDEVREHNETRLAVSLPTRQGTYLEFESTPDYLLKTKSLEDRRKGIRLLNIKNEETSEGSIINKATVFIPKGKENHFLKKINDYINENNLRSGKPKNQKLIESINDIKLAVLESFWIGPKEWMPNEDPVWCEIWLSRDEDSDEIEFRNMVQDLQIEIKSEKLRFPERRVLFIKANKAMLQELIERSPLIAEIRRATETAAFFVDLDNKEQTEWANELIKRVRVGTNTNTCISILDTGINNGHILINPVLKDSDCYSYNPLWGTFDHCGHGTKMAGLSIYGDLQAALECSDEIEVGLNLESYKIIPPKGENEPELYGAITIESVSNLIIENPEKKRIICMAITAPLYETGDGSPSSWSAAIDELTSGYIDGQQKLFLVSAGNIEDMEDWKRYPYSNIMRPVQNPGQSWNAITVGAYTEKCTLDYEKYGEQEVVAKPGGLSPYSSTSFSWDTKWPIKPEIVLEGGNLIKDSYGCYQCDELSVLTTHHKPHDRQFSTICATSAATAQASWMAAQIQLMYPDAWPETVRALLIHSAKWTEEMKAQFLDGESKKDYKKLLRTCGYGVPNLERAIRCVSNSVNLIIQSELQPFTYDENSGRYITNEMHVHEIPWPKELLEDMFNTPVEMKVTLSYFIEPGPGEIGWKDRYRYPSCALRFDVNGTDTKEMFLKRINRAVADDDENIPTSNGGSVNWVLGPNNRNVGSIHSDIWQGTAAELSTCNLIGVYPAIGWWRERHHLGRWNRKIRYSLIVSISTPEKTADLYTSIINKIKIENKSKVKLQINK